MIRDWRAIRLSLFMPGSKKFWALKTDVARLLFIVLVVAADDEGRLEGTADDVKVLAPRATWTVGDVEAALKDMEKVKLIVRYHKKTLIQIINYVEMAIWHGITGRGSKIPGPPLALSSKTILETEETNRVDTFTILENRSLSSLSLSPPLSKHLGKEESEEGTRGQWSMFSKKYKHLIGKKPQSTKTNQELYGVACLKYGEVKVLAALERCIPDQSQDFMTKPVFAWKFLKDIVEDFIEEPQRVSGKKHQSKAEEREETNREVLKGVLGGS
jgi:hypothetical protein